jgi:hypothetical protein
LEPAIVVEHELTTCWRLGFDHLLRLGRIQLDRLDSCDRLDSTCSGRSAALRSRWRHIVRNTAFVNTQKEVHDSSPLNLEFCGTKIRDVSIVVAPQEDQLPDHRGIETTIHPVFLAIEPVGRPIKDAQEAVRFITLVVEGPDNAPIVFAHVIVETRLQRVVVLNHARVTVIYSDREVTGRVASVKQPGWSMVV